jgi:hypothetical protein
VDEQLNQEFIKVGQNDCRGSAIAVCKRCLTHLKKKKFPSQAFFNMMTPDIVPEQLAKLNPAEIQMISQVRPFMKIFNLNHGRGQMAMKGTVLHFPNSVEAVSTNLPLMNTDAEFLIVQETSDIPNLNRCITVRPNLIYEALNWLKDNNVLYQNIIIQERQNFELQPLEMIAPENLPNSPVSPLIPVTSTAYSHIGNDRRILRASMHQGSEMFSRPGRGIQCAAMSATAMVYAAIQDPSTWSMTTMNEILMRGDEYYREKQQNWELLTALQIEGTIDRVFGALSVAVSVREQIFGFNGQLNRLASYLEGTQSTIVNRLTKGLDNWLNSNYHYAVLTIGVTSMGLIEIQNRIYIFDSHSRGAKGVMSCNGLSCIIEYPRCIAVDEISKLVHRNLEPKANINFARASEMEKASYFYNITPVEIECQDEIEEVNEVIENIQEIPILNQMETEEVQNETVLDVLSNLCQNANVFGEVVITDSVFHSIDHRVPELIDVIEANKVTVKREKGRLLQTNQESYLEELSFVNLFPFGKGGISLNRPVPITPLDYFQSRIMSPDTKFWDTSYLFYALSRMEEDRIKKKIAICGQIQNLEQGDQNQYPGLQNIHLYMSSIRGSASYWKKYTGDLIAMIQQLGVPTFFLTISSDDLNSPDSLCGLLLAERMRGSSANQYFVDLANKVEILILNKNLEDIPEVLKDLTYEQKCDLLNRHPVHSAKHFSNRVNAFLRLLKKSSKEIFGFPLKDYTYRVEFQHRGSGHIHMLIWLDGIPEDYHSEEGIAFIDSNVKCSIPNDDEALANIVIKYQNHHHTPTCFKNGKQYCRFDFPRKMSPATVILDQDDAARNKGRFVLLKRTKQEVYINNYHPVLLKILKCNMDLQVVTDANAVAYYIAKYISKAEPTNIQAEIQKIIQDMRNDTSKSYYQMATKIAFRIMNNRQVGAPEAAFRLCHLPLRHSSRGFVFVPAYQPQNRLHLIQKETIGRGNIRIGLNIIDRYMNRPDTMIEICLLEFAAWYKPCQKPSTVYENANEDCSSDEECEDEEELDDGTIALKFNKGLIKRRKRAAIVKHPHFDIIKEKENYYYCMLLLYYPFVEETFNRGFEDNAQAFRTLSDNFRKSSDSDIVRPELAQEIDKALTRIALEEDPCTPIIDGDNFEGYELEDDGQILPDPGEMFQAPPDVGDIVARRDSLSVEQREVYEKVYFNLNGEISDQLLSHISGAGGCGKSYLIDTLAALIALYETPGNENALLKAAPTG